MKYNNKKRKKEKDIIKNELLCKLYAIAFIKIYIYKYVHFAHFNNQEFIYQEEMIKAINKNGNTEVIKMIKIYIFKVFYYLLGNYHDFIKYNYQNHGIYFIGDNDIKDIIERFKNNEETMLNYYMIPNDKENGFKIFKQ